LKKEEFLTFKVSWQWP